ncbi:SDR family oxidoreductase [Macrococcus capreoli]
MTNKTVLITGTSTGLGLETAILMAKKGYNVYATMRNLDKQNILLNAAKSAKVALHIKQLDVTDSNSVTHTVNEILLEAGTIDILINNAGAGFVRSTEQATEEEMMWQLNLNLMGVMRMTKAVLPTMREQRSGHIINISSVGGLVGQPFNEIYCATKFGVEGYTEALASYLQPHFNVKFTAIEPAGISSEFSNSAFAQITSTGGILEDEYKPLLESYINGFQERSKTNKAQTPAEVAEVVVAVSEMNEPPIRIRTSDFAETFTQLKTQADPDGKLLQEQVRQLIQ